MRGGISIPLEFPGQIILSGAIKFLVCHTRNRDTLIFMQGKVIFVQKLERFKFPRASRSFRYYMLTCSLSEQLCVVVTFYFPEEISKLFDFSVAFLMLDTKGGVEPRWSLCCDHTDNCFHISLKRRNYFLHLLMLDLSDLAADGWAWSCSSQSNGFPPLFWMASCVDNFVTEIFLGTFPKHSLLRGCSFKS